MRTINIQKRPVPKLMQYIWELDQLIEGIESIVDELVISNFKLMALN